MNPGKHISLRKHLCLVLAAFLCFSAIPAISFAAEGDEENPSRAIAIAYDNSGSMMGNGSDRNPASDKWCNAKYSIEVFAAMLNEQDTMSIYTMDSAGCKLTVSGSQDAASRVSAVHDADFAYSDWTDSRAAREAYESLLSTQADEKYLVITTDGAFNAIDGAVHSAETGVALADVQSIVSSCAASGIEVIYLAIGGDASTIAADEANGVYVKSADSSSILSTMTEVAAQIFGRDSVPDSMIGSGGSTLSLDVPMSKLIVFAQGASVEVGDLTLSDGSVLKAQKAQVKYSDTVTCGEYDDYLVNTDLQGVVATYTGNMPQGDFSLDISGAEEVEVYYSPYVDIAIGLSDENGVSYELEPGAENELSAGSYDVEYSFLDPFTGEDIDSELLSGSVFSTTVEQDGQTRSFAEGEKMEISRGSATITAAATTAGGVKVNQTYQGIEVQPEVSVLTVDASGVPTSLEIAQLEAQSYPVVVSKADGSAITSEEWATLDFSVEDDSGIVWEVVKRDEVGTVDVTPQYVDDDPWATQEAVFGSVGVASKRANLTFTAKMDAGGDMFSGSTEKAITYGPDVLSTLAHVWPWLLLLLVLLFLIYKYITKPRLPRKMKPAIVFRVKDGGKMQSVDLEVSKIKHSLNPFRPETCTFKITNPGSGPHFPFAEMLPMPLSFEVEACKKVNRHRRFALSIGAIKKMKDTQEKIERQDKDGTAAPDFPKPKFSDALQEDKKRRTTYGKGGSSLAFYGWIYDFAIPGEVKGEKTKYTIKF